MRWYVIHTLSGFEKRVRQMILDQIAKQDMSEFFEDIIVPVVEVSEVKYGKNIKVEKKFMPGYILIKMNMVDKSWHLVKSVTKITGFLGGKSAPHALSEQEVQNIFTQLEIEAKGAKVSELYKIGTEVVVIDGPFETFSGVVEGVNDKKNKLRVSILIFGKATPIELNFTQVKNNT